MRRERRLLGVTPDFLMFLVSDVVTAAVVNVLAANPQRWPSWMRPVAEYPVWAVVVIAAVVLVLLVAKRWRPRSERPEWHGGNPYPGLAPFEEATAATFFGRDDEVLELENKVLQAGLPRDAAKSVHERSIWVVGPSGSGKSSLVRAGLIPRLKAAGMTVIGPFEPGNDPLDALARALAALPPAVDPDRLAADLRRDASGAIGESAVPDHLVTRLKALGGRTALVVDQVEELVLLSPDDQRVAFLALIRSALRSDRGLFVIGTLRSEFLGYFQTGPATDLVAHLYLLMEMEPWQIRQVVEGPADKTGTTVDADVVDNLVESARGSDALPMLCFFLRALYNSRKGHRITDNDYKAVGELNGFHGFIAAQAEDVVDKLAAEATGEAEREARRKFVLDTLLAFVAVEDHGRTRRRVPRAELTDEQQDVVDRFVEKRLLTTDIDDRAHSAGPAVITLAHEALLRQWPRLKAHVDKYEERLRLRTKLERLARDWVDAGRGVDYLLRGDRLREAREWFAEGPVTEDLVTEFVGASDMAERREHERQRADLSRRADAVARDALTQLSRDPETAIQLATAAVTELAPTPLARRALYTALGSGLRAVIHDVSVDCPPVFSPDGRIATVTGAWIRHGFWVHVWNSDGTMHCGIPHDRPVNKVAWSLDGRLATATEPTATQPTATEPDGRDEPRAAVRVWTLSRASGQVLRQPDTVLPHDDMVTLLAWSPEGHLATTTISAFDPDKGAVLHLWHRAATPWGAPIDHVSTPIAALAWSPDGLLAVATQDTLGTKGTVALRSPGAGVEHRLGFPGVAHAMSYAPDGRLAIGVGGSHSDRGDGMYVWSGDGEPRRLDFHPDADESHDRYAPVTGVAWSPHGELAAVVKGSHEAHLWSADGTPCPPLRHDAPVSAVAWSPTGVLATATGHDRALSSERFTASLWSARGERLHTFHLDEPVSSLGWSPHDDLATTTKNGVRIWSTGEELARGITPDPPVGEIALSPDGLLAVAVEPFPPAIDSYEVHIYSSTGRRLRTLSGDSGHFEAFAWSLDGRLAVATGMSGEDRGTIDIWPAEGTAPHTIEVEPRLPWLAWSSRAQLAALGRDSDRMLIFDPSTAQQRPRVLDHDAAGWGIMTAAWSPDGTRLATIAGESRTARLWPADDDTAPAVLQHDGEPARVNDLAWSDRNTLATGELVADRSYEPAGKISFWSSGGEHLDDRPREVGVTKVRWGPNQMLATIDGDAGFRVTLWNASHNRVAQFDYRERSVRELAWSPDGRLATATDHGADRGMVHIWSRTGEHLLDIEFEQRIRRLHWLPGNRVLVWAGGTVHFLPNPFGPDDLVAAAGVRTLRPLTEEQRHAALLPPTDKP